MTRIPHCTGLALALLAAWPAVAQTTLTPPAERISDAAIDRDHRAYESMQARIRALGDAGRPQRDLHLAKAQCWLDTSFHEYTRNDRGAYPQAALAESEKLVDAMERKLAALPEDTPLVAGATRLRPDLWAAAAALRGHAGWRCAQAAAGCAEVELVHAGHEFGQQGWRHAQPYVQLAEDLVERAQAQAAACAPPPVIAAVAPAGTAAAAPAVPAVAAATAPPACTAAAGCDAPPPAGPRTWTTELVFEFDGTGPHEVHGDGWRLLDALLDRLPAEGLKLQGVTLAGHADRLRGPGGAADYNQQLSERRVATVRERLLARGVPASLISGSGFGDRLPVESCAGRFTQAAGLRDCLLPNRRVEVRFQVAPR